MDEKQFQKIWKEIQTLEIVIGILVLFFLWKGCDLEEKFEEKIQRVESNVSILLMRSDNEIENNKPSEER